MSLRHTQVRWWDDNFVDTEDDTISSILTLLHDLYATFAKRVDCDVSFALLHS
jgi:hypothetical protein